MWSTKLPILAPLLMLALPGCTVFGGSRAIIAAADVHCAAYVPKQWTAEEEDGGGVQHTPDPVAAPKEPQAPLVTAAPSAWVDYWRAMYEWAFGEQKKWINYGISEHQKVEDANGRMRDGVEIISHCEDRDAAAVKKVAK